MSPKRHHTCPYEREGRSEEEVGDGTAEARGWSEVREGPPEARKGRTQLLGRSQPCWHLSFRLVKLVSNLWPPEI